MTVTGKDQDLINASKIVIYYVRMYVESYTWLQENSNNTEGWNYLHNSMLEVHLLYTRTLIEFITKKPTHPSDIFAISYFYDYAEPPFPVISKKLSEYKDLLDKQLAHITSGGPYGFKIKSDQSYDIHSIANELIPHLQHFFEIVPEDRIFSKLKIETKKIFKPTVTVHRIDEVSPST